MTKSIYKNLIKIQQNWIKNWIFYKRYAGQKKKKQLLLLKVIFKKLSPKILSKVRCAAEKRLSKQGKYGVKRIKNIRQYMNLKNKKIFLNFSKNLSKHLKKMKFRKAVVSVISRKKKANNLTKHKPYYYKLQKKYKHTSYRKKKNKSFFRRKTYRRPPIVLTQIAGIFKPVFVPKFTDRTWFTRVKAIKEAQKLKRRFNLFSNYVYFDRKYCRKHKEFYEFYELSCLFGARSKRVTWHSWYFVALTEETILDWKHIQHIVWLNIREDRWYAFKYYCPPRWLYVVNKQWSPFYFKFFNWQRIISFENKRLVYKATSHKVSKIYKPKLARMRLERIFRKKAWQRFAYSLTIKTAKTNDQINAWKSQKVSDLFWESYDPFSNYNRFINKISSRHEFLTTSAWRKSYVAYKKYNYCNRIAAFDSIFIFRQLLNKIGFKKQLFYTKKIKNLHRFGFFYENKKIFFNVLAKRYRYHANNLAAYRISEKERFFIPHKFRHTQENAWKYYRLKRWENRASRWLQPVFYNRKLFWCQQKWAVTKEKRHPNRYKSNKPYVLFLRSMHNRWNYGVRAKKNYRLKQILFGRIILPALDNLKKKQYLFIKRHMARVKPLGLINSRSGMFLGKFERRVDILTYKLNFAPTIQWAREFVKSGLIYVSYLRYLPPANHQDILTKHQKFPLLEDWRKQSHFCLMRTFDNSIYRQKFSLIGRKQFNMPSPVTLPSYRVLVKGILHWSSQNIRKIFYKRLTLRILPRYFIYNEDKTIAYFLRNLRLSDIERTDRTGRIRWNTPKWLA